MHTEFCVADISVKSGFDYLHPKSSAHRNGDVAASKPNYCHFRSKRRAEIPFAPSASLAIEIEKPND